MARPREKGRQREVAAERIRLLLEQASERSLKGDGASASRCVRSAHKLALRCNVRVPRQLRSCFCRKCFTYFTSDNSRRRLNPRAHRVEITCLGCGYTYHLPYAREKKKK